MYSIRIFLSRKNIIYYRISAWTYRNIQLRGIVVFFLVNIVSVAAAKFQILFQRNACDTTGIGMDVKPVSAYTDNAIWFDAITLFHFYNNSTLSRESILNLGFLSIKIFFELKIYMAFGSTIILPHFILNSVVWSRKSRTYLWSETPWLCGRLFVTLIIKNLILVSKI